MDNFFVMNIMHKLEKFDTTPPYYGQRQGTSVGYVPTDSPSSHISVIPSRQW